MHFIKVGFMGFKKINKTVKILLNRGRRNGEADSLEIIVLAAVVKFNT